MIFDSMFTVNGLQNYALLGFRATFQFFILYLKNIFELWFAFNKFWQLKDMGTYYVYVWFHQGAWIDVCFLL